MAGSIVVRVRFGAEAKRQIGWLVDKLHVGVSDVQVARDILRRASHWPRRERHAAARYAIRHHHANRDLYVRVQSGRL